MVWPLGTGSAPRPCSNHDPSSQSSNAAGDLASLSDSSLPAAIWPSFPNVAFIKYPHSQTFESKNKGTSCLPDGRHFLRHNFI